jgi:hypothetical protein
MSASAFGSEWARLENYTFRFSDPLNKERRFVPLRLDDAPIKGSLAQFLYINWPSDPEGREQAFATLLGACRPPAKVPTATTPLTGEQPAIAAMSKGEPPHTSEDHLGQRRDMIEQVFSAFEPIHAFLFKVCIDYLSLIEVLHAGLAATEADRDRYYGYIKEIGQRLHEMHILEGRLRVAGAEQAVQSMQQYKLQATEVNDMLQLQRPKLRKSDVRAVADELFRRKDRLYQELAKALKAA